VFGVCFGFMSSIEHKALAQFFISSLLALCIPVTIWLMYTLKVIGFNKTTLASPVNEFIYNLRLFTSQFQWILATAFVTAQLLPIIGYAVFLMVMALDHNLLPAFFFILVSIMVFVLLAVSLFILALRKQFFEKRITFFGRIINHILRRHHLQFFIEWLVRNHGITLSGTKVFCYVVVLSVLHLYTVEIYDVRLLAMALTVTFAGNLVLVFYFHRFENYHLSISRMLPITLGRRMINFLIIFSILCIPETGLLIKNFPAYLSFFDLIQLILLSMSTLVLVYALRYIRDTGLEKFTRSIFLLCMLWIIMILFMVPIWIIAAANVLIGSIVFRKNYYAFEYVSTKEV
jgi:hypothetical protein